MNFSNLALGYTPSIILKQGFRGGQGQEDGPDCLYSRALTKVIDSFSDHGTTLTLFKKKCSNSIDDVPCEKNI